MVAAAKPAVTALLAAGADIMQRQQGCTALTEAAVFGQPEIVQMLMETLLQQHKEQQEWQQQQQQLLLPKQQPQQQGQLQPEQQQPQQQQQQPHGKSQLMQVLQEAGAHALSWNVDRNWHVVLTLAADALGEEAVRSLCGDLKKQAGDLKQLFGGESRDPKVGPDVESRPTSLVTSWTRCWLSAWGDVAAQRSGIIERLQQLVIRPFQQQQQEEEQEQQEREQRACVGRGWAIKPPGLPAELAGVEQQQQLQLQPAPARVSSQSGHSSSCNEAVHGPANSGANVGSLFEVLLIDAASGSEQRVRATLGQLPDSHAAAGLLVAAVGAGSAGQWGLFFQLLREVVLLPPAVANVAFAVPKAAAVVHADMCHTKQKAKNLQQQPMQQEGVTDSLDDPMLQLQMEARQEVCDAFFADWLALRQQRVRELREAVVAAAEAGAAASAAAAIPAATACCDGWGT
jgi:hypothetical protein